MCELAICLSIQIWGRIANKYVSFLLGSLLPYCLDWGPEKHSAYNQRAPDSESVTQFGRTPIRIHKLRL